MYIPRRFACPHTVMGSPYVVVCTSSNVSSCSVEDASEGIPYLRNPSTTGNRLFCRQIKTSSFPVCDLSLASTLVDIVFFGSMASTIGTSRTEAVSSNLYVCSRAGEIVKFCWKAGCRTLGCSARPGVFGLDCRPLGVTAPCRSFLI